MARALVVRFAAYPFPSGDGFIFVYASPPSSAGRTRNASRNFKLIATFNLGDYDPPLTSLDITAAYLARYGTWAAGQRIFVAARGVNVFGIAGPLAAADVVSS